MNRIIKFRVWDYCANAFVNDGEGIGIGEGLGEDHFGYEVEYQQFTGLYDKNGKEIYEGDILKVGGYKGSEYKVEVKWQWFQASDDMGVNTVGFRDFEEYTVPEVIGNIFEKK